MKIINPYYEVDPDRNIFNIREKEYAGLLEVIRQMLIPVEELGFEIRDCGIKESRHLSGELQRTIKQNLVLRFQKGTSKIDISMQIPKLVEGQYFVINGRKKIPLFQLFDIPIVTRGKNIKIQTNVGNLILIEDKDAPYLHLVFMKKKVPFFLLLFAYYGPERINEIFEISSLADEPILNTKYDKLLFDLKSFYDESRGITHDDIIKELGSYYSKFNNKSKGYDIVYAVDLITDVDVMSARFLTTGNVLEEFIHIIKNGGLNDTDFVNKRIRCFEYVILSKVARAIFDLCCTNRTLKSPKFNVNSTAILSECNVSDIVSFDFAINPIDELTKLSRTSLVGPGGFNKQNVPKHLRDLNESMFGRICPIDTPDRDNCGVLQNLLPNTKLDEDLRFTEDILYKQTVSIPVAMVPGLEHNDQTRMQMSSSQQRQAIMLQKFDTPLIKSGCESLYTKYTKFVKTAKKNGEVVYVDEKYVIIFYADKTVDIFNISYRKIYTSNLDVFHIYVKPGDKVKPGDIIAESNFCKNGEINIGKNLLTAVMPYYGMNYEDGIVISDRIQKERIFTSVHYEDLSFTIPPNKVLLGLNNDNYKPLPDETERILMSNPYAILKEFSSSQLNFTSMLEQPQSLITKHDLIITEANIYANKWFDMIPEYKEWVETKIEKQKEEEEKLKVIIKGYLPTDEYSKFVRDNNLDRFGNVGKFKIKGEEINGIFVEMFGIYFRQIQIGDKIGNRHGNKGVISNIVPHDKMPKLEDGRHADICINPLGIIGRINIGQLYELHLGMAVVMVKKILKTLLEKGEEQQKIKNIFYSFIKIVDKTEDKWYGNQVYEYLCDNEIDDKFIEDFSLIQAPFESVDYLSIVEVMEFLKVPFKYKIYEPVSKMFIENPVAVGYMYFFKMVHIAKTRLAARGIGSYSRKTLQPMGGRKLRGGQRLGEMETACLIGHDSIITLEECLTTKSDCIDLKNKFIKEIIGIDTTNETDNISEIPESVNLLNCYLTALGVNKD